MRVKVELFANVVRYINHQCSDADKKLFYHQLEAVRDEPVRNSEFTTEPSAPPRVI